MSNKESQPGVSHTALRAERFNRKQQREAQKRLQQEAYICAERARTVASFIRYAGPAAVVALEGSKPRYFMDGIEANFGSENVAWFRAPEYVQGKDDGVDQANDFSRRVSELRRTKGFKVVGFSRTSYQAGVGTGNPAIIDRLHTLIQEQAQRPPHYRDLGVVAVGFGTVNDLPTRNPRACSGSQPFLSEFEGRFALDTDGELAVLVPRVDRLQSRSDALSKLPQPVTGALPAPLGMASIVAT